MRAGMQCLHRRNARNFTALRLRGPRWPYAAAVILFSFYERPAAQVFLVQPPDALLTRLVITCVKSCSPYRGYILDVLWLSRFSTTIISHCHSPQFTPPT